LEEETKEHGTGPLPPTLAMAIETPPELLTGFHLMKLTGTEDYAGSVTPAKKAQIANLLDVPERVTSAGNASPVKFAMVLLLNLTASCLFMLCF